MAKKNRFRDRVKANIQKSQVGGSQYGFLRLPKGVDVFKEDASTKITLDILPYKVTEPRHPDIDEDGAILGDLWWKRPYKAHRNIGAEGEMLVCPTSVGKKCPICEHRRERARAGADKEELREMNASHRNLYVVVPRGHKKYEEKVHLWDISYFLFHQKLEEELQECDDFLGFPDPEDGNSLKIRWTEKSIGSNSFAEASRIDFEERDPIEQELLDEVPDLDQVLTIESYDKIKVMFFELEDVPEEFGDDGKAVEEAPKRRKPAPKAEEEEEEEEAPAVPRKRKKATPEPEPEEEEEDEEEEEEPAPRRRRSKPAPEPEEEEEEEEEEEAPPVPRKRKKAKAEPVEGECPHDLAFGIDTDTKAVCNTCDVWEACMEAKERAES